MESGTPHDFDNVDTTVLEVIKENIVSVLKTVVHQKTLESIVRKDLFTGLYSEEYLYGEGKKIIDQYTISTICMFKIINIQEITKIITKKYQLISKREKPRNRSHSQKIKRNNETTL